MKFFYSQFLETVCVSKVFGPTCSCKSYRSTFCKTRKGLSQMKKPNPGRVRSGTRCEELAGEAGSRPGTH